MKNCWHDLKNKKKDDPILALAPLASYTDSAFRTMCKNYGADIVYSEMASVSGVYYKSEKTLEMLKFQELEKPYVVQIFGSEKKHFAEAVKILEKELKPDGFDINFGCPVKKVIKQGAGAKLMSNLKLSREIIEEVLANTKLPLSIKLRTESHSITLIDFLKNIEDLNISALMIHGRTLNDLFSGPINTEIIKESRNYFKGLILANGGINHYNDIEDVILKTGADGVGIARGALGRPWIFSNQHKDLNKQEEKLMSLEVAISHCKLHYTNKGDLGLGEFKGHLAWYLKDFPGASNIRKKLMLSQSFMEINKYLSDEVDKLKK